MAELLRAAVDLKNRRLAADCLPLLLPSLGATGACVGAGSASQAVLCFNPSQAITCRQLPACSRQPSLSAPPLQTPASQLPPSTSWTLC